MIKYIVKADVKEQLAKDYLKSSCYTGNSKTK